jgi:hypothetical protein
MSPILAGVRDRLVAILALSETVDDGGFPVEAWAPLPPDEFMWKHDLPVGERFAERFVAEQWSARQFTEWECGFRADMDPDVVNVPKTRRLSYRGREYQVVQATVLPHEDGHGIRIVTMVAL